MPKQTPDEFRAEVDATLSQVHPALVAQMRAIFAERATEKGLSDEELTRIAEGAVQMAQQDLIDGLFAFVKS